MNNTTLIKEIKKAIDNILIDYAFDVPNCIKECHPEEVRHRWRRSNNWKIDEVSMQYPVELPSRVWLQVQIYIETDRQIVSLVGANLEWLVTGRCKGYYFPFIFKSELIKIIINHVRFVVPWFDLYGTPSKCLYEIGKERHCLGGQCGLNHEDVVLYLNKIRQLHDEEKGLDTSEIAMIWQYYCPKNNRK